MLLFSKNIQRMFTQIPRILPLNSTVTRFKIWEIDESQKKTCKDKKIHSVSIETGQIYASLEQSKVVVLEKDPDQNPVMSRIFSTNPNSCLELKTHVVNEHILNGEPNHVITIAGLNAEVIKCQLKNFLRIGHRYGSTIYVGRDALSFDNHKSLQELLSNVLIESGLESILQQPVKNKCESGIIQALVLAEKIEQGQENSAQNACKK